VDNAAAKSGASEETDPSINPARPGWITCSINARFCSFVSFDNWIILLIDDVDRQGSNRSKALQM
jgi:hypothetical protein